MALQNMTGLPDHLLNWLQASTMIKCFRHIIDKVVLFVVGIPTIPLLWPSSLFDKSQIKSVLSNGDSHCQDVSVTATFTLAEESARPDQPLGAASGVMLMTPTPVMTPESVSTELPTPGHVSPVRTMVSNTSSESLLGGNLS